MTQNQELTLAARAIFREALKRADAGVAVHNVLRVDSSNLFILDEPAISLSRPLYVVAIGKAAFPMAEAFDRVAGKFIKQGVVSGTRPARGDMLTGSAWSIFFGGHPLPNEESFEAAKACLAIGFMKQ